MKHQFRENKYIFNNETVKDRLYPGDKLYPGQHLNSTNGKYMLAMQKDGNLVIYTKKGKAIWATGTNGKKVAFLVMQKDGNLVIYTKKGKAIWATGTNGKKVAFLVMQNDRNLVIYTKKSKAIWATGTHRRRSKYKWQCNIEIICNIFGGNYKYKGYGNTKTEARDDAIMTPIYNEETGRWEDQYVNPCGDVGGYINKEKYIDLQNDEE